MKFAEVMMDKPLSFYDFKMLYWCGIREGELLALTPADFDFEKRTVSINKSYQRLNGQDLVTTPKIEKSNRVITMPQFLAEEIQDYLKMLYGIGPDDRIFTVTKSCLHREMDRGSKEAGVPRIRIHDIRHSAVALLIDMGFSATVIADRVGHEIIEITYNYAHLFPSKQTEMADKWNKEEINDEVANSQESMEEMYRRIQRMSDPAYLHTVTLDELMDNVFEVKSAVIENLLYTGAYILAGAPKIGKSFLVAQIVHHTRKQPTGDSFEKISGTTGLSAVQMGHLSCRKKNELTERPHWKSVDGISRISGCI